MRLGLDRLQVAAAVNVATAGSHTRTAPALARHAKIETTMAIYADITLLDLRGALEGAVCTAPAVNSSGSWAHSTEA